jgi:hypothetical protein
MGVKSPLDQVRAERIILLGAFEAKSGASAILKRTGSTSKDLDSEFGSPPSRDPVRPTERRGLFSLGHWTRKKGSNILEMYSIGRLNLNDFTAAK